MHYYQFNIGDYSARTQHLDLIEDLAYRRMIDLYVRLEGPLPKDVQEISRLIRMRSHCDCIANVLRDFFSLSDEGYIDPVLQDMVDRFREKSNKAKKSAEARWKKGPPVDKENDYANAMRTQCEGNANHKPITINHKPRNINKKTKPKKTSPEGLDVSLPDYIDKDLWAEWLVKRQKLKCSNTVRALTTQVGRLEDINREYPGQANQSLEEAIDYSYKAVYPPKGGIKSNGQNNAYKNGGYQKQPTAETLRSRRPMDLN